MAADFWSRLQVVEYPPGLNPGGFDCGEQDLNDYLVDGSAERDQLESYSRTYLVRDGDSGELVGYFSVLCDAIRLKPSERPRGIGYGSAPAIKLGRMGVQKAYRGRDVGGFILIWVIGFARSIARSVGVRFITLDALPRERLVEWYKSKEFELNQGEKQSRKILRRAATNKDMNEPLPHVSMRYDILLAEEVPLEEALTASP